ncbi:MAG TPA: hypothetical protein VMR52_11285 [Dehalococcoidia bacterium]|nr:hypothetical protein [Dehalococcoidia bacterium]
MYVDDSDATGNSILGNSIYDNDGLGIDLDPIGLTVNDPLDVDTGANNRQNFPLIVTAVPGSVSVVGELNSVPLSQFRIEFFHNDACDQTGFGEGKTFIGFVEVETDAEGNAPFAANFTSAPTAGFVTSTATHQSTGDTSEFSNCVAILSPATPTPTPSPEPSETPEPTLTATPSVTATPSGTDAPTDTATPTATAAPEGLLWGDVDCSGGVDPVDALKLLRHDAGLSVAQGPDCPPIGDPVDVGDGEELWGDIDCSDGVHPVDALKVLRFDAGLVVQRPAGCPDPGETVAVSSA